MFCRDRGGVPIFYEERVAERDKAAEQHAGAVGHEGRDLLVLHDEAQDDPAIDGTERSANDGKGGPGEKAKGVQEFFRARLREQDRDKPDESNSKSEPFAGVHLFAEVEVGE